MATPLADMFVTHKSRAIPAWAVTSHDERYRLADLAGMSRRVWKPHDAISEALDNYLNDLGNCGEYVEFIDANPVPMTADGVREFMTKTEQAIQVAVLTEKLVMLLGEIL